MTEGIELPNQKKKKKKKRLERSEKRKLTNALKYWKRIP